MTLLTFKIPYPSRGAGSSRTSRRVSRKRGRVSLLEAKLFPLFQKGINYPYKLVHKGNNGLPVLHTLLSFLQVVVFEVLIRPDSSHSHDIEGSPQRLRALFADYASSVYAAARLGNGWVSANIGNELLFVFKPVNISDLGNKVRGSYIAYAFYRGENINIIFLALVYLVNKLLLYFFNLLKKKQQVLNIILNKGFIFKRGMPYGVFGKLFNILMGDINSSAGILMFEYFVYLHIACTVYFLSRRIAFEKIENCKSKDIVVSLKLRKGDIDMLLELGLGLCNILGYRLSKSCYWNNTVHIVKHKIMNILPVFTYKKSNNIGINLIGFGFSQRNRRGESLNKRGVDKGNLPLERKKKANEIDMKASCGFTGYYALLILISYLFELIKTNSIHRKLSAFYLLAFLINNRVVERTLGNINTDKVTHLRIYLLLLICVPLSCLPFDSGFKAKSTNRDLKGLRLTPYEALKLRKNEVFQSLGVYHDVKPFYKKY